ncbi:hypothetical protein [Flavisolibacter tropicus]|nr:hypothetical protein [Flavisolibacter tropicus]
MKSVLEKVNAQTEPNEEFYLGATITIILLFLLFIGTTFYIAVSSYMEI